MIKLKDLLTEWTDTSFKDLPKRWSKPVMKGHEPDGLTEFERLGGKDLIWEELTDACIPYEIGIAHFKEISRAHIMGEEEGILKLLFDPETLKILGIHIIGPHASELIHLGHSVMFYEGTIQYFMNTVFNSPTLDEAYRIAAFNGMNRLDHESL